MLALRKNTCFELQGERWRNLCRVARREIREAEEYIAFLNRKIAKLERHPLYDKAVRWWKTYKVACVYGKENAGYGWDVNTGNGYYGGMQMDLEFQRDNGAEFLKRWGTANNWPAWAQIVASYKAWTTRGFHPWPNTARMCGLL